MTSPRSVAELGTAAAAGDATAWEQLVDRYAGLVWSVWLRYRLADAMPMPTTSARRCGCAPWSSWTG